MGPINRRYAAPSRPSDAAVSARSRRTSATEPSSRGWPIWIGGSIHSSPWRPRSSWRKKGDGTARGWTALQISWTTPGWVSSAERIPPPIVDSASKTATLRPVRAIVIAAARPFGPLPTTTASYSSAAMSTRLCHASSMVMPRHLRARARSEPDRWEELGHRPADPPGARRAQLLPGRETIAVERRPDPGRWLVGEWIAPQQAEGRSVVLEQPLEEADEPVLAVGRSEGQEPHQPVEA